ncbi:MAG: DUF5596 domain-containing protein [Clostridia bacterium]|nr:DUF5596 domain-containing protein [Clostridia bacterium]
MKAYLSAFLDACAYEQGDAAYLLGIFDRIVENEDTKRLFDDAIALYDADSPCDHERILALADKAAAKLGIEEYTTELLIYLCLSKRLHERYRARGIDDTIFYNTMLDLRYKLEECKAVKGIIGSFVAFWFGGFFELTRFALGRLQFEIIPFNGQYEKDGKKLTPDSKVINVHIPRTGTRLDPDSCEQAYREAAAFFADQIDGDLAFVCYSWLLFPDNAAILPENSNIVKFMSRYDVVHHHIDKNKNDLWRLFDTDEKHPDRLPTDTTARRCYVQHLKNGGKLGCGSGVFFYEIEKP